MKELGGGFNIVGLSQGNLIGRGIVEFCDGAPPVRNSKLDVPCCIKCPFLC
ncbi:hypothetical protein M5K25_007370 [Dendrobium thyrsiflorum]|uniref:Uncharacterized protein n=1 Tax=Dendrobium thyrsiflorum TaxID=117978 RepID=A0ABD0VF21_DENTH